MKDTDKYLYHDIIIIHVWHINTGSRASHFSLVLHLGLEKLYAHVPGQDVVRIVMIHQGTTVPTPIVETLWAVKLYGMFNFTSQDWVYLQYAGS